MEDTIVIEDVHFELSSKPLSATQKDPVASKICPRCEKLFKNYRALNAHKLWCGKPPRAKKTNISSSKSSCGKASIASSSTTSLGSSMTDRQYSTLKNQEELTDSLFKQLDGQYAINGKQLKEIRILKQSAENSKKIITLQNEQIKRSRKEIISQNEQIKKSANEIETYKYLISKYVDKVNFLRYDNKKCKTAISKMVGEIKQMHH